MQKVCFGRVLRIKKRFVPLHSQTTEEGWLKRRNVA